MAGFAINRKDQNKGVHNGRGLWLFEEFMFADSVFGRSTVRYRSVHARDEIGRTCYICSPAIEDLVIFDDDGNDIPLDDATRKEAAEMVLEAFWDQVEDVREAELVG